MHVRDNMIERDIILTHQPRCELRGAVDGDVKIVAAVYTHFDPDGRPVSRAFVISVLSGFVSREGLVNGMIVHSEMPGEKSSAIVTASEPLVHGERVIQCVGTTRRIVCRMNSDKCRPHRPMQGTPAIPRRDDALRDSQFGCSAGASPLTAARRGVTAQEEKKSPIRTTARNPNVRSFTVIISAFARGKLLKGCRVRMVPNCSAFRKRNRFGLQTYEAARKLEFPQPLS